MRLYVRHLFIVMLVGGYFFDYPLLQAVSLFLYSGAVLTEDTRAGTLRRLDVSTTFAFLLLLTSFSHFGALSGWFDTGDTWANYLIPEHLEKGLFVFSAGAVVSMEAMRYTMVSRGDYRIAYPRQSFFVSVLLVSLMLLVARHFGLLPSWGTVTSFVQLLVNGSIFLLAYMAHVENRMARIMTVVIYSTGLSLYAIQFSYLRMEIIVPWLAYFMGEVVARRQILRIHLVSKTILVVGLVVFPVLFTYLGKNRESLRGSERKLELALKEGTGLPRDEEGETLLSRLNVMGQMSNIVDLTERKGFYEGFTLRYFSFVFIPRFIWPEKPILDGGQWFAVEIGRSYYLPSGRAANSVNMTVPGEMYLNFGWSGLIAGCTLFGFFVSFIWNSVRGSDLISWAFRFYLLFLGMFSLGSDMMVIPQLMAYWLIYKTVTFFRTRLYA